MDEKKIDVVVPAEVVIAPVPPVSTEEKKPEVIERDYKKEAEELRNQLGKAEHTIVTLKKEKKEDKEDDDPIIDQEEITQRVEDSLEKFKIEQSSEIFEDELTKLSSDPDKKALIKLTYEGKIIKGGFSRSAIQSDLATALAIVDRPRVEKTINELKQASISDKTKKGGSASGQDITSQSGGITDEMLSPIDRKIMARQGLTLEDINKGIKK